jgi:hypothetical protein
MANKTYNIYCDESCHLENDHKKFMFTELDRKDDECIVYIVRGMANELKGGQDDKS